MRKSTLDCIPQVSDNQPRGPAEVRFGVVVVARCLLMELCTIAAWPRLAECCAGGLGRCEIALPIVGEGTILQPRRLGEIGAEAVPPPLVFARHLG